MIFFQVFDCSKSFVIPITEQFHIQEKAVWQIKNDYN